MIKNTLLPILLACIIFFALLISVKCTQEYFIKNSSENPKIQELKNKLKLIFNGRTFSGKLSVLNDRDLLNEVNIYPGKKSYTINKKNTYLCLKDKKTGEYYDDNILMYVLIHELAHSINTNSVGHPKEFWEINDELLELAAEVGIYNPSTHIPDNYCK